MLSRRAEVIPLILEIACAGGSGTSLVWSPPFSAIDPISVPRITSGIGR
jgi:hypothetical protein